jgi:hypothetical protein
VRRKVKIKHYWDSSIIRGQFVFAIIDRIHEDLGGILPELDVIFIPVVVQLDAQAILQIDHMLDEIEPLHEYPDIDIHGFPRAQAKPILAAAGRELLGSGRRVVRLIVVVSKPDVEQEPVGGQVRGIAPLMAMIYVHGTGIFLVELPVLYDDQITDTDRILGCSFPRGIGLRMASQGQA